MLYNEEIELDEDFEGVDDSGAEVVTEFDEIDENTDYNNKYQYTDIDFPQDTPELIETPDPVVDPVVEDEDPIPDPEYETISETYEIIIQEYSQEYLQELEDSGYTFYVVYEDGTEDEVDISEIEEPTTNIEFLDDEAYVLANSILEHFWDDDSGVHVTQDTKEDWAQLVEDNFPDLDATHPHHNIIVNSYGVLIRSALKNLVQLSRSALAFYDGLGNNSSNIISTFGRGGIQIGPTDQKHLVINNNGITVYNGDGTVAPLTASNIQAIEANIQTLTAADAAITGRLTAAEGNITTLTSSKADVTDLTAATGRITSLETANTNVTGRLTAAEGNIQTLTAADVSITGRLDTAEGNITNLTSSKADVTDLTAATGRITSLETANTNVTGRLTAAEAVIDDLDVNYAHLTNGVIDNAKIDQADVNNLSTNYAHIANGIIDNATIDKAKVNGLSATYATIESLNTAKARITSLESDHVSADDFEADHAIIESLDSNYAHITNGVIDNAKIGHADVNGLSANYAHVSNGVIDNAKIDQANVNNLSANYAHIANGTIDNAKISYADVNGLSANYAQVNMANVNNAWIQNGTVKDGAITNAMINSVSANKLTAGTIDASNITVTNLNADNITTGTINGQRIGAGSLSLDKLEDEVYTKDEVDDVVDDLNDRIDGAIETFTGTVIPTLNNTPASAWTTNDIKDTHVGDVYYVVNSQSDQNGYCYRFTKINNAYSWQLIKDSDVTAALARLTTAEGKIGTIETFDSTVSSFMTNTDQELTSIKSAATTLAGRVTTAEGTLLNKVDTTTFNSLSQTVDGHTSSITQLTTETSTLTQAVDTLNTKTSSDSGNIVQFSDSIGFKEIVVHGKSTQASYTGKNLFDVAIWINDGKIPSADTGVLASSSVSHRSELMQLDAGTYTYSLVNGYANGPKYVHAYDSNGTWLRRLVATTAGAVGTTFAVSFTVTSDIAAICIVAQNADTNVQIEQGSTATSYEPYVGAKAAPNPDYPQPIVSVDDLTLRVCGKNLFDPSHLLEASGWTVSNGVYTSWSSALHTSFSNGYPLPPFLANTRYTISFDFDYDGDEGIALVVYFAYADGGQPNYITAKNSHQALTSSADRTLTAIGFSYGTNRIIRLSNIQVEEANTATDYEPYQGHSIDIPLGDHQIRSLPDGTDDTLTFSYIGPSIREGWGLYNTELVQKINIEIFDGSESGWTKSTGYPGGYYLNAWAYTRGITSSNKHIQDHFITANNLSAYSVGTCLFDNSLIFRLDNTEIATLNDFKSWLSENPVTVQYVLVTPITHSLGVVELPLSEDLNLWASTSPSTTIDATWWHEPGQVEKNEIDISLTASNLGNAIDSTTLSAPYTEVEWVESNGAQYVYLDWKPPVATWGFEADFIIRNAFSSSLAAWNPNTNMNGYGSVFGTRNASVINDIQLTTYNSNGTIRWGQTGDVSAGLFKKDKTRQQISLRGTTLTKADGTTVTITRSTEVDSKFYANMAVFCVHEGLRRGATGGIIQPGSVRIYSLKFYDGDDLKVDLVGALRNRDGLTGLYDKVSEHFYPAYGMTYGDVVGDLGIPDTILEAVAKSKINVHIDNRQISRMWRVEVPELNRLEDGQTISVTFSTNIGSTTPAAAGLVGWDETATTAYANVFLKLVLADETETDWIPCFYAQGTRLTSHYGSGTPILLTYRENVLYGASTTNAGTSVMRAWYADPNYVDGNTQYTKYSNSVIAGLNGIKRYTLCMKDQNGKWTSIINQANTVAATKTCYTGGLQLDTILYYNPANEIAAGNNSSDGLWESFGIIDWRYSFNVENNATNGLTYRTPLYLVGTLSNSDGLFYLDTTKWWTQVPNDPTKIYIWVSAGYTNYYQGILSVQNTVYAYDEDVGLIEINVSRYSKTTTKLNETIDTVDEHTQKIGVLESTVESKADGSDVEIISNTLNTVSQTATSNSQKITNLTTRLGTNADGTAGVNDIVAKESALEQDLDTFKTTVSSTYSTKTELSAVQDDISDLQEGSKLSSTEIGAVVTVDDALVAPPIDIIVYGKSAQASYTGKNLLNLTRSEVIDTNAKGGSYDRTTPRNFAEDQIWVGLTMNGYFTPTNVTSYNVTSDSITLTSIQSGYGIGFPVKVTPNTTYSIQSDRVASEIAAGYFDSNGSNLSWSALVSKGQITTPSDCQWAVIIFRPDVNASATFVRPQLELGSTATDYEPYVGAKAAPNPDYPQEIKSIDDLTLHVCGKNLFGGTAFRDAIIAVNPNSVTGSDTNGSYVTNPCNATMNGATLLAGPFKSNTVYTIILAAKSSATSAHAPNIQVNYTDGTYAYLVNVNDAYSIGVFRTSTNRTVKKITALWASGTDYYYYDLCGIFEGVITADQFESYVGASASIALDNHILRSLPDGTKDELDFAYLRPSTRSGWAWYSAELVQRAGTVDMGTLTWGMSANYFYALISDKRDVLLSDIPNVLLCTEYQVEPVTVASNNLHDGFVSEMYSATYCGVILKNSNYTTAADLKASLSGAMLQYLLATPITTDLGEVELPIMPSEHVTIWYDGGSVQSDISIDYWLNNAADIVPHLLDIDAVSKNDITAIETRVSTAESTIEQHSESIELKANSSDVYTKQQSDGLISTEVTNRNAAITAATNAIELSVRETYASKKQLGSRNLVETTAITSGYLAINGGIQPAGDTLKEFTSDYIPVSSDKPMIFQYWVSVTGSGSGNGAGWMAYGFYDSNKSWLSSPGRFAKYSGLSNAPTAPVPWHGVYEINDIPSGAAYIRVSWRELTDGIVKLERRDDSDANIAYQVNEAKAAIKVTTDSISTEVSKKVGASEVISKINQSAESIKIQASKVEIDGAAIFSNTAFRQAADNAYDAKGSAQTVQNNLDNLEIGGRNLAFGTAGVVVDKTTLADGTRMEYFPFDLGQALPFGAGTPIVISFDLYMPIKTSNPTFLVYNSNKKGPHQTLLDTNVLSGKNLPVGSIFDERIVIETSVYTDRSDATLLHDWLEFYSVYGSNNYYRISNLKLEKGNHATDWTPAPEDVAASAVKRTQRIWYRKSAVGAPATPGEASSNWVTKSNDGSNAWTKMHISITASEKYIYTCEQYEMADGKVGYTSVLLDNTITVIDGGSIITNSITANQIAAGAITAEKLNATNINASNSLTIGALSTSTQSSILNSELSADIASAAKRTDVSIAVTAIDYTAGTATLQASLYIDGVLTTSGVTYQWLKDGTNISGQTSRTLSVTSAMGLSHVYSCTATY